MIQNPPDLHKLFVRFSQPKSFNIFRIFDEYERLHAFGSHAIYNIGVRVVSDILSLAFGSSLYIRYNTAAHVVNSTCGENRKEYTHYRINLQVSITNPQFSLAITGVTIRW